MQICFVSSAGIKKTIHLQEQGHLKCRNFAELLSEAGLSVPSPCGGGGRCGKCRVRFEGADRSAVPVTDEDRVFFSQEELEGGWRLACRAMLPAEKTGELRDLTIFIPESDEAQFVIEGAHSPECFREAFPGQNVREVEAFPWQNVREAEAFPGQKVRETEIAAAIDIGTTTIAATLVDLRDGHVIASDARLNSQRRYGADVISRIQASVSGRGGELQELILNDLETSLSRLADRAGITLSRIQRAVIAGNTVMEHLLMGYPCESLGKAPFIPYKTGWDELRLFMNRSAMRTGFCGSTAGSMGSCTSSAGFSGTVPGNACASPGSCTDSAGPAGISVQLLPVVSAYIGADITAGLYTCGFATASKVCMLIDLGTNAEMAIGNKDRILCTSAAAGPAFEGGNISCGVGSIPGAICDAAADPLSHAIRFQTIADAPACGICGTGVIALTSELLAMGLLDETGLLDEDYFDDGYPLGTGLNGEPLAFTQKDIRELQLAKAAVRAGVETLLKRYGIKAEEVERVYLAGGFGKNLPADKALAIGMLPPEFAGKLCAVGNSALSGALLCLTNPKAKAKIDHILEIATEINLSADPVFSERFMGEMFFPL